MAFKLIVPDYPDQVSRDAHRAGYSDGYHGFRKDHGDWPIQPYSRAYWEGRADREPKATPSV